MKKLFSMILALAMVACMSVTAFAADGTTVLTVEVPNEPAYTLHIPASMNLDVTDTGKQTVGDLYVTDVTGIEYLWCAAQYTDLINTADATDKISLTLWDDLGGGLVIRKDGKEDRTNAPLQLYWANQNSTGWNNGYQTQTLSAQVSDWSGATHGATYQATITYVVTTR